MTGACSFIRVMMTSPMTSQRSLMTILMAILMTSDDRNAADCSSVSLPSQSQILTEARDAVRDTVRDSVRDSVVTW